MELHLANARDGIKIVLHIPGNITHLGHGKAFGCQSHKDHGDIAELVVNKGAYGSFRQLWPDIIHFVAQVSPDLIHIEKTVVDLDVDDGNTGSGLDIVNVLDLGHLADIFLHLASDEILHPSRRHPWKVGGYHRIPDGNNSVLLTGEVREHANAGYGKQCYQKHHQA